jgi:hypothetical protein
MVSKDIRSPVDKPKEKTDDICVMNVVKWITFGMFVSVYMPCMCCGICCGLCGKFSPKEIMDMTKKK